MTPIKAELIAPCGMNCALCISNQRKESKREKHCEGCNNPSVAGCVRCTIRRCVKRERTETGFCYECPSFPCKRMVQLDARYRKNYGMSVFENLEEIKRQGLPAFLEREAQRRTCPHCGELLCIHRDFCLHCKTKWREGK